MNDKNIPSGNRGPARGGAKGGRVTAERKKRGGAQPAYYKKPTKDSPPVLPAPVLESALKRAKDGPVKDVKKANEALKRTTVLTNQEWFRVRVLRKMLFNGGELEDGQKALLKRAEEADPARCEKIGKAILKQHLGG